MNIDKKAEKKINEIATKLLEDYNIISMRSQRDGMLLVTVLDTSIDLGEKADGAKLYEIPATERERGD